MNENTDLLHEGMNLDRG